MANATRTNATRTRLLGGVGTTVLAALMAGGAHAAETRVVDQALTNPVATGHLTVNSPVANIGAITATVTGAQGGQTVSGTQAGTTNTVTANIINANATANTFANALDLSLIDDGTPSPANDGAAALGVASNATDGTTTGNVTASVIDSSLALDLTDFTSGTAVNSANRIEAVATGNAGTTVLAGAIPNGYASTTQGSSAIDYSTAAANLLDAGGTVVASSVQANQGVTLGASVNAEPAAGPTPAGPGNSISLTLSSTFDNDVDSSPTLDANTIGAALTGNTAASTIDIQAGGAPTFEGSAVLTNLQGNVASSASATNSDSTIAARVEGDAGPPVAVNTLNGGLSVQGNTISSALFGNQANGGNGTAGNRIVIGDAVSVDGPGTGAAMPGSEIGTDTGDLQSTSTADFVIQSSQGNVDGPAAGSPTLASTTENGAITAFVRSLEEGTITLAGNEASAQTVANSASSAVASGANAASFEATVTVSNQQANDGVAASATTSGAEITAVAAPDDVGPTGPAGVTNQSAVAVSENTIAATGIGNDATQTVALAANTLNAATGTPGNADLVGGTGGTANEGNVTATGNVTIASLQANYGSALTVLNENAEIGLGADSRRTLAGQTRALIADSTLTTDMNTQEAVALANRGTNALSLDGNTVGAGAGIASVQAVDTTSPTSSTLSGASVGLVAGTHVEGSSLAVTRNTQRAAGYGNTATNTVSVDANAVNLASSTVAGIGVPINATGRPFHSTTAQPDVLGAFGLLSDQSLESAVTAAASANLVGLSVAGDLTGGSADNDRNILMAAGQGLDATNRLALDAGTIDQGIAPSVSVGQLANTQAVVGADVSAIVSGGNTQAPPSGPTSGAVVLSFVEDMVDGSTVSTSANSVQAVATGSEANNALDVTATTIDAASTFADVDVSATTTGLTNTNAFGLTNAQSGDGTVTASLAGAPTSPVPSASIVTLLGSTGDPVTNPAPTSNTVTGASVTSDTNVLTAEGTGNRAVNALSIAANAVTTNSGLQNFQDSNANITTAVGEAGPPANASAVRITTFGEAIADSALSVAGNQVNGAVTANSVANALSVEAATIATTTGGTVPTASVGLVGLDEISVDGADHALVSEQRAGDNPGVPQVLDSTAYGAFTIDTPDLDLAATPAPDNVTISGTTLDVAGNSVRATSVGNVGDNALDMEGSAIRAVSALVSRQSGIAAIDVTAGMDVRAPAAVGTSSVNMSSNTNTALGVLNDATNAASVSGASVNTVASTAENADLGYTSGGTDPFSTINADHMVHNTQQAGVGASLTSTAATSIANNEAAAATTGLVDSTLVANGNATYSEASANRATNSLALDGASALTATGGVSNRQNSFATVEANATSNVALTLAGTAVQTGIPAAGALSNGTVTMEGNSTEALARANRAVNTLEAVAGAGYAATQAGSAGASVVPIVGPQSETVMADATYAMLNMQTNAEGAPVSARSENAVYRIALNADPNATAGSANVTNGTVSLAGNRVTAQALGNSAVNRVSLVGLNTGSPTAAIGSSQTNTAGITSTVNSATLALASAGLSDPNGVGSVNPVSGSSFALTGNSVSASATGNSVSNAIARVSR